MEHYRAPLGKTPKIILWLELVRATNALAYCSKFWIPQKIFFHWVDKEKIACSVKGATTISIMTFSITTLSIMGLNVKLTYSRLGIMLCSNMHFYCYAEYHCAECRNAVCRFVECRFIESCGALTTFDFWYIKMNVFLTMVYLISQVHVMSVFFVKIFIFSKKKI